ncbi:hypothetical protein [Massilia sp. Root418]|uniref:hypothetical protein n=1 Tax=Massilia sp. Root418 TaxID=1736532 RepID=UPI000B14CA27|nr:hypothetical protein [Massilia sp. Root418]
MKHALRLLPLLAVLLTSPSYALGDSNSSSVSITDGQAVGTLRGSSAIATVLDDKVELRDGAVYVNGQSYGPVPRNAEVKYVIRGGNRTLLVDGKPRKPAAPAR